MNNIRMILINNKRSLNKKKTLKDKKAIKRALSNKR